MADKAPSDPKYWDIVLLRRVVVNGHAYRPGIRHVVNDTVLAALGDAVGDKTAVKV